MGPLSRMIPRQNVRTVASGLVVVFGILLVTTAMGLAARLARGWLQLVHPHGRARLSR